MKSHPSYYGILPADVRYDSDLCSSAKLLYSEFTALCEKEGYSWATNKYFAGLYGVAQTTISEWIGQLEKKGHLVIERRGPLRKIHLPKKAKLQEKPKQASEKAEGELREIPKRNTTREYQEQNGGNNPLNRWKEPLKKMRALHRKRGLPGLHISPRDETIRVFRDVDSDSHLVDAYRIYLDDQARYLVENAHPWRCFLQDLGKYVIRARNGQSEDKRKEGVCCCLLCLESQ